MVELLDALGDFLLCTQANQMVLVVIRRREFVLRENLLKRLDCHLDEERLVDFQHLADLREVGRFLR